jgi:hypothetical protein
MQHDTGNGDMHLIIATVKSWLLPPSILISVPAEVTEQEFGLQEWTSDRVTRTSCRCHILFWSRSWTLE